MQWEYKLIATAGALQYDDDYERLGNEGWELVYIRAKHFGEGPYAVFKRPKVPVLK